MKPTFFSEEQIRDFLNKKYKDYNRESFIENDPVSIPHRFSKREDIEISGFLTATLAWGQRKTIIQNSKRLMEWMDYAPHQFILNHTKQDLEKFSTFAHRTFNTYDCLYFISSLRNIYRNHGGILRVFESPISPKDENIEKGLQHFRTVFFELPHLPRTEKHVSSPEKNSSCKRLNMYLRWMVRKDSSGVDFGIAAKINSSQLVCPLDVHSGRVALELGILKRTVFDWKAALELTENLKRFCPEDPVKYDFALFGAGVNRDF